LLAAGLAVSAAGCAARSASRVTGQSIATIPAGTNLIDGTFKRGSNSWRLVVPNGASDRPAPSSGDRVLEITAQRPGGRGILAVDQTTELLPSRATGSEYALSVRVRARHLSRRVRAELRLNYAGGGYEFFGSRTTGGPGSTAVIRGTTHGWQVVEVRATAQLPLASIEVFALDSRPERRFSGSVWLAAPRLVYVGRRTGS
jgi:hypothetical protein